MKNLYYIAFLATFLITAQETMVPEIMNFPDISEQTVLKHSKIAEKYGAIEEAMEYGDGVETLSDTDRNFMIENEQLVLKGPFSTAAIGCDWYCAGGPNKVESSSVLTASKTTTYEALNAHDWDLKTAWATNKNKGIGEVLTFYFAPSEMLSVTHLKIYNGYQKSETTWKNNSRAKEMEVSINAKFLFTLQLEDTIKMQQFNIWERFSPANEDLVIALKITKIYPGEKYSDLCLSEVNFDGKGDH